jgi:hypothetical protein
MKNQIVSTWKLVMDHQYNPLKYMKLQQRHLVMQMLAWMWSMIFSLSFMSIYVFGYVWIGHVLVIGGVFITFAIFERARASSEGLEPVANLSGASKCVWQMDREA